MSNPRDARDPVQQMAEVEAFLADVPDAMRSAVEELRAAIRSALPDPIEKIADGVPAFYVNGKLVASYGVDDQRCSLDVHSPAVVEAHASEVPGSDAAGGTVAFKADAPLPSEVVEQLVRARLEEIS